MKIGYTYLFLVGGSLILFACTAKTGSKAEEVSFAEISRPAEKTIQQLTPAEMVMWVRDPENGCRRIKRIDEFEYDLQYKPYEYIACIEGGKETMKASEVEQKIKELEGMIYFDLRISAGENTGELMKYKLARLNDYQERINYFSFGMQKDLFMVQGSDTIPCALFHFERTYDMAPYSKFLLGFPVTDSKSKEATLFFYDKTFDKGIIKISFNKEELSKVPKLETI